MRDARAPVGVGMRDAEGILGLLALQMLVVMLHLGGAVGELGVGQRLGCHDGIGAGLVDGDRVEAREHADVVDDRRVVFGMAIAVGADIHGERDVEARTAVDDGLGVLGDLTVEHVGRGIIVGLDAVLVARRNAASAAHAAIVVDGSHVNRAGVAVGKLALTRTVKRDGAVRANLLAGTAANTVLGRDVRLAGGMLLHLAGAAAAAHAQVLHGAAKAGLLMALKVGEADHDIGIHERLTDLGLVHVLAALDRDERLVGTLEAVGDDDLATRGIRGKAVLIRGIDVLERVFAATHIERVAVGEEGLAAQLLHDIRDGASVVGAQKAQIAQLAKVNLDSDELVLKVDLLNTGVTDEALKLVELALASMRAQVGEVHLSGCCGCSCGHRYIPSVYMALQT